MTEPKWGTTRETVAAWCALPISWNRKREGFRSPPKLAAGDAAKILAAAGPTDHGDLDGLAYDLDEALSDLADARDSGYREDIADARDNAENGLDEFYDALRAALHPDVVAAENARLAEQIAASADLAGLSE